MRLHICVLAAVVAAAPCGVTAMDECISAVGPSTTTPITRFYVPVGDTIASICPCPIGQVNFGDRCRCEDHNFCGDNSYCRASSNSLGQSSGHCACTNPNFHACSERVPGPIGTTRTWIVSCFDLNSDDHHCGDCATACPDGQHCSSGRCRNQQDPSTNGAQDRYVYVGVTEADGTCGQYSGDSGNPGFPKIAVVTRVDVAPGTTRRFTGNVAHKYKLANANGTTTEYITPGYNFDTSNSSGMTDFNGLPVEGSWHITLNVSDCNFLHQHPKNLTVAVRYRAD